jgi:hypothetical protein
MPDKRVRFGDLAVDNDTSGKRGQTIGVVDAIADVSVSARARLWSSANTDSKPLCHARHLADDIESKRVAPTPGAGAVAHPDLIQISPIRTLRDPLSPYGSPKSKRAPSYAGSPFEPERTSRTAVLWLML